MTPAGAFEIGRDFKHPIIRAVNEQTFLVADGRANERVDNCFSFDFQGTQLASFFPGDGIQDIEVMNNPDRIRTTGASQRRSLQSHTK